jgi:hypothetical protein
MAALLVASGIVGVTAPAAGAAGSNSLNVTAGEYTYQFKGSAKAGFTQVNFVNAGTEMHMMGMVHLKPGVTAAQLKTALLSSDQHAGDALVVGDGNVGVTPGLLGPGEKSGIILKLPAGHFGVFCFISAPDGQPHVAHGMVKTFDIAKGKSNLTPPTDGVVKVTLTDTTVGLPATGLPARGYAKVTNTSATGRNFSFVALEPGATVQQASQYFDALFSSPTPPPGPAPGKIDGGFQTLAKGASVYLVLGFAKGNYGYRSDNADVQNDPNPILGQFAVK